MKDRRKFLRAFFVVVILAILGAALVFQAQAAQPDASTAAPPGQNGSANVNTAGQITPDSKMVTSADRVSAAGRAQAAGVKSNSFVLNPAATPDYFGTIPNYANSPLTASTTPVSSDHYWPWFDSKMMQDWVMMSTPSAYGFIHYDLSIAGAAQSLPDLYGMGPGMVPGGKNIAYTAPGIQNGPVKATASQSGNPGITSQRMLMGNSLEELPGAEAGKQSDHFYWSWYDEQTAGMQDWVMVSNPSATDTVHVVISYTDPATGNPTTLGENDIGPGAN